VRKAQDGKRNFGTAPTAAWSAFRKRVPLRMDSAGPGAQSISLAASEFLKNTPARTFYQGVAPPGGEH
jgi:hypothetical protein